MEKGQATIPGTDTELSRAADAVVDLMAEQGELNDRKESADRDLLSAMQKAKKTKIRHRGITLEAEYIEAKYKIKKTKKESQNGA